MIVLVQALLGTYRCTDVPGEFVWQPGSLTRAVCEGLWIVLEDIDYAPMDVISVLVPLLQSGTLSIPGHGDNITPAPGFRLFATQRSVTLQSFITRMLLIHKFRDFLHFHIWECEPGLKEGRWQHVHQQPSIKLVALGARFSSKFLNKQIGISVGFPLIREIRGGGGNVPFSNQGISGNLVKIFPSMNTFLGIRYFMSDLLFLEGLEWKPKPGNRRPVKDIVVQQIQLW